MKYPPDISKTIAGVFAQIDNSFDRKSTCFKFSAAGWKGCRSRSIPKPYNFHLMLYKNEIYYKSDSKV